MSTERQPLDAGERELARVLRALPAGEPPSALDAKILAMARDAVMSTPSIADEARPRARRAPRFAWGLGVAASCVLAAGLVYRMGGFGTESLDGLGAPASSEAASEREPAPAMPEAIEDSVRVDLDPPRAHPTPAIAAPPPPPELEPDVGRRERQQAPVPAVAAAAESAEPFAADEPAMELRDLAEQSSEVTEPEASAAPAMAPAPPSPAAAEAGQHALDSVSVTGSRIDPDLAPPISEDGRAGTQVWIQRIRARIARGDVEGARQSLEAFIARHPGKVLPQDLIDFRQANAD